MRVYEKIIIILLCIIVIGVGLFTAYTTFISNRVTAGKLQTLSDSIGRITEGQQAITEQNLVLEQRLNGLGESVSNLGGTVSSIGTEIRTVRNSIQSLGEGIQSFKARLPELENIVRKSNERIGEASSILRGLEIPTK